MLPVNLILRVFWIFSISPQGFGLTFHQEFFITFLSFSEITRRGEDLYPDDGVLTVVFSFVESDPVRK